LVVLSVFSVMLGILSFVNLHLFDAFCSVLAWKG